MQFSRFHNMSLKEQQDTQSYVKYGTKYQSILTYFSNFLSVEDCYFLNLDEIQNKYLNRDGLVSTRSVSIKSVIARD